MLTGANSAVECYKICWIGWKNRNRPSATANHCWHESLKYCAKIHKYQVIQDLQDFTVSAVSARTTSSRATRWAHAESPLRSLWAAQRPGANFDFVVTFTLYHFSFHLLPSAFCSAKYSAHRHLILYFLQHSYYAISKCDLQKLGKLEEM